MKNILDRIKTERLYFDGGTGTVLQKKGLFPGEAPEIMNRRSPETVRDLHIDYILAGADIIKTNTFGINSLKYSDVYGELSLALSIAHSAREKVEKDVYIAFDVGPTGRMLKPFGDLEFEDAVSIFAENMKHAESLGADIILIETMGDVYEIKAAVLAAKENSSLPIFVTCAFGSDGKLLTGADPCAVIAMLESMGVSCIGMNCSVGPHGMKAVLDEFVKYSSLPIIVNPNAGLPSVINGETVYDLDSESFSDVMRELCEGGACLVGGCCGTTPEYIGALKKSTENIPYSIPKAKEITLVSSYTHAVRIGDTSKIVGERINPTGKPKLKRALLDGDVSYVLSLALEQERRGAHILDVNVGLADIDEASTLLKAVTEIQAVCDLPLQIDTGSPKALESAMRSYSGKPLINSVNGSESSITHVFPLVKKYGGAVIALTMDDNGIPSTVEGRVEIAMRIAAKAEEYGISSSDLIFDPLALTVASNADSALVTLEAIKRIKALGYKCSLGVSNISFGLPERDVLNSAFYSAALFAGLDLGIINPSSESMMRTYYSSLALLGKDEGFEEYCKRIIEVSTGVEKAKQTVNSEITLRYAIKKGLKIEAFDITKCLLKEKDGLEIVNTEIIPALNEVGLDFEMKRIYLPGLLMSAEAAASSFEVIREMSETPVSDESKKIILATVKGDIHDIGKNIVKLIFESYGYKVIDLGRDVDKKYVVDALTKNPDAILGLSALMTTTLDAMAETVALVKDKFPHVRVIVGGAVLTESYAGKIGADFYAPDALSAIKYAEETK